MKLYSLNSQYPQPLPYRVRTPDGFTRTDPSTFTYDELVSWGYTGPYNIPSYNPQTETYEWNAQDLEFDVRSLTDEELSQKELERYEELKRAANWSGLYNQLLITPAFLKARDGAAHDIEINAAYTDIANALGLASQGSANIAAIQVCFNNLLSLLKNQYELTQEERDNLNTCLVETSTNQLISLNFYIPE